MPRQISQYSSQVNQDTSAFHGFISVNGFGGELRMPPDYPPNFCDQMLTLCRMRFANNEIFT